MKRRALALGLIVITFLGMAAAMWVVQCQSQITRENKELQVLNNYFEGENRDLQDEKRSLLLDTNDLKVQNYELLKQLGDLTEQLALQRALRVKIVALSHEERWSDYGPFLGRPRARMVFNITVQNDDVVALGLQLTVKTFSGYKEVGWIFHNRVDSILAGEVRNIEGESITPIDSMVDLSFVATLKSGDVVVDELRLSVNATPEKQ